MFSKDHAFGMRFADDETILQVTSKVDEEDWIKLIIASQNK